MQHYQITRNTEEDSKKTIISSMIRLYHALNNISLHLSGVTKQFKGQSM